MQNDIISSENLNKVFNQSELDAAHLSGNTIAKRTIEGLSVEVLAPENEGEPMSLTYTSTSDRQDYTNDVFFDDNEVAYDYTKTLGENIENAISYASDAIDEAIDWADYEKKGPEKYYGATPRM